MSSSGCFNREGSDPVLLVVSQPHFCNGQIAIAAARAGAIGILDLCANEDEQGRQAALSSMRRYAGPSGRWGVAWDVMPHAGRLPEPSGHHWPLLLLAGLDCQSPDLGEVLRRSRELADRVMIEAYCLDDALAAQKTGFDGVVLKGQEAGGRAGKHSTFLLLHEAHGKLDIPYWVRGGISTHTAAAATVAGAAGIVLGEQLWLARESPLNAEQRAALERLDGSETVYLGDHDVGYRFFSRSGRATLAELVKRQQAGQPWLDPLREALPAPDQLIPAGEEIAFADSLARKHVTVADILSAYRAAMSDQVRQAHQQRALAEDSPLALAHRTSYPLVQGPMTRVSDVAPFCETVSRHGALPTLALALMRKAEVEKLLDATSAQMGERTWGVGILGFVPGKLREEQLEVVCRVKPAFAIIAGGRPEQAVELERAGIFTYLHVPSPGLLEIFLREGAPNFILEGRECGGHVGPRHSLTLWGQAIDLLLRAKIDDPAQVHVLFAGGIHNRLSAAMVAAIAAPLVARGMKIGLLMGTAYLFTPEAVDAGAVTSEFQQQALACRETTLLESGIGHASRCAVTPFTREFQARKRELVGAGADPLKAQLELELLNLGRLRLASKGVQRRSDSAASLVPVTQEEQRRKGMFMIGDAATRLCATQSMAELHADLCRGGLQVLADSVDRWGKPSPLPSSGKDARPASSEPEPLAIVGMECFFPESENLRQYWHNILRKFNPVREVPADRWSPEVFFSTDRFDNEKLYSKWGAFLGEMLFDPFKYKIPPNSLASIEPIQLLSLEVAWRALADAGYWQRDFPRQRTAVIFGVSGPHDLAMGYGLRTLMRQWLAQAQTIPEATRRQVLATLEAQMPTWTEDSFPGILNNLIAGRISNHLDLQGPNFVVDAACASSLAALHIAVEQLRSRACDVAVVGSADGTNGPAGFMSFSRTYALSPRGKSCPFDQSADGIVLGEGVAAMVLKRLADAERDGDFIYAVVRGIGASSDGRNCSITAPNPEGQMLSLRRAYDDAGVPPQSVSLVEGHGTGTTVGDAVELQALQQILQQAGSAPQSCAIGSVKSMLGHTKAAAGMASLVKIALALKQKVLPPTSNVETPNQQIDPVGSPLYPNTETRPWIRRGDCPRRAGVSAFGFGGTNFHAVLEEYTGEYYPGTKLDLAPRAAEVFYWVRPDRGQLIAAIRQLEQQLDQTPIDDLAQLAFSVWHDNQRRAGSEPASACRLAIVAGSVAELQQRMRAAMDDCGAGVPPALDTGVPPAKEMQPGQPLHNAGFYFDEGSASAAGSVCFLLPGQGAQRPNMLKDLLLLHSDGISIMERADGLLESFFDRPLSSFIYPVPVFDDAARAKQAAALNDTAVAQPALCAVALFALDLLRRFGLTPDFAAGHSLGEYAALHVAGCLTADDLLRLAAQRGRAVQQASRANPGGMAAVAADAETTAALLLELNLPAVAANRNAPDQTVIAGPLAAIDRAIEEFGRRNLAVRRVHVTAAFHTAAMRPAADEMSAHLENVAWAAPRVPIFSNTTAAPYPADGPSIQALLTRHFTAPVRFVEQIEALYEAGARFFIEAGAGNILTNYVTRILAGRPHTAIALDAPGREGGAQLTHLLARCAAGGLPVRLEPWFACRGLSACGTTELFAKQRDKSKVPPVAWIVSGHKARPANGSQQSIIDTAKPFFGSTPMKPVSSSTRPEPDDLSSAARPEPSAGARHENGEAMAQFQANMGSWLELQKQHQQASQRFLDLQEQALRVLGNGAASPAPPAAPPPAAPPRVAGHRVAPTDGQQRFTPPRFPAAPVAGQTSSTAIAVSAAATRLQATAAAGMSPGELTAAVETITVGHNAVVLPTAEEFRRDILEAASARSGYPIEMLKEDALLEADLGIDSIKRIEIFSGLKDKYFMLLQQRERTDEEMLGAFTRLKTLRDIVQAYDEERRLILSGSTMAPVRSVEPDQLAMRMVRALPMLGEPYVAGQQPPDPDSAPVERFVVRAVEAPPPDGPANARLLPRGQSMLVLGEMPQWDVGWRAMAMQANTALCYVLPGAKALRLADDRYEADLASPESVKELHALLRAGGCRIGGIINMLGLAGQFAEPGLGENRALELTTALVHVAAEFEGEIAAAIGDHGGRLFNLTSLGGKFGLDAGGPMPLAQAGTLGVFKSLAHNWPGVRVKNIDIDRRADPQLLLSRLAVEFLSDDEPEIGLTEQGRWRIDLQPQPLAAEELEPLNLDANSVVLLTGGARGVTGAVAMALAERYRCRLVLVGRSPLPGEEAVETRELQDEQSLHRYLVQEALAAAEPATPAEIDRHLRRLMQDREIRRTIQSIARSGATADYRCCDVSDGPRFARLIEQVYEEHGRIDGVIHGAGVIEDRRLADKTADSIIRVFNTKVNAARVLAETLRPERLRFLVFFSSVAARFGNAGQLDYAAANEYLNKLADQLAAAWPARVVAINWGPWESGMVTPTLARMIRAFDVGLIPMADGVEHCLAELGAGGRAAEVVIGCSVQRLRTAGAASL